MIFTVGLQSVGFADDVRAGAVRTPEGALVILAPLVLAILTDHRAVLSCEFGGGCLALVGKGVGHIQSKPQPETNRKKYLLHGARFCVLLSVWQQQHSGGR
jgi:hypothetical protein